jgi:hypothetical protein
MKKKGDQFMRTDQNKKSWIGEWLGIVFFLLILFVICVESWSQCNPGVRDTFSGHGYSGQTLPWMNVPGNYVPGSVLPPGGPLDHSPSKCYAVMRSSACYTDTNGWIGNDWYISWNTPDDECGD